MRMFFFTARSRVRRSSLRGAPGRLPSLLMALCICAGWVAGAQACPRDGTLDACQCLQRVLSAHPELLPIQAAEVVSATSVVPTLTGATPAVGNTQPVHISGTNINDSAFTPPHITIYQGDTIQWLWDDGFHSVRTVSTDTIDAFNSGFRVKGDSFSHTFNFVGDFVYYCGVHGSDNGDGTASGQAGSVTVLAVPEPTGPLSIACAAGLVLCHLRGGRKRTL